MTTKECNVIRQEIDEADRPEGLTSAAEKHLHGCNACRGFAAERTSLRQLLGDLGTVTAPSDFDFRLKARLAREKSADRNSTSFASLLSGRRLVTTAVLIFAVAAGVFSIRYVLPMFHRQDSTVVVNVAPGIAPHPPGVTYAAPAPSVDPTAKESITNPTKHSAPIERNNAIASTTTNRKPRAASRDIGLSAAAVVESNQDPLRGVVLVPLDDQALRISLDDGRGAQRMVSLPIVSFGSQRLMTSNSFVPEKSSPKGVW